MCVCACSCTYKKCMYICVYTHKTLVQPYENGPPVSLRYKGTVNHRAPQVGVVVGHPAAPGHASARWSRGLSQYSSKATAEEFAVTSLECFGSRLRPSEVLAETEIDPHWSTTHQPGLLLGFEEKSSFVWPQPLVALNSLRCRHASMRPIQTSQTAQRPMRLPPLKTSKQGIGISSEGS